ncbi:hypothetical protein JDV02_001496 [Purpureocillium takamizusanense]|uniref:Uncharacterized protein n=1 Tax=Purpureocillium takamizusanense TaxID=2060973 RepID=A0A9Q8Q785_9HYPO|nr:uncharacterized protein JDV02_001496 [Purpureocillium takamizusanense]UNI14918.1 hypothetical protein JDV02_001496 [Purpureocillium takamizusanense]
MTSASATKNNAKRARAEDVDVDMKEEKAVHERSIQTIRIMKLDKFKKSLASRQRYHLRQKNRIIRMLGSRVTGASQGRQSVEEQMFELCKLWSQSVRTVEDVVMTGYDGRDDEIAALAAYEAQDVEMTNATDDEAEDNSEDSLMTDVGDEWPVDAFNNNNDYNAVNTTTDVEMVI